MDDQGINEYLKNTYGTTFDGKPLFRIIWSTNETEKRFSEFHDFYGEILLRIVKETRECLKYPFAQDRWVLERLIPIHEVVRKEIKTDDNYIYNEIYIFQDGNGNFLPLNRQTVEQALYFFFKFFLQMSWKERTDLMMENLARKEMEKRERTKEITKEIING